MADRRSISQTEARGMNISKSSLGNITRDDLQAVYTSTGSLSAIAAAAAATPNLERRSSQAVFKRLSVSMNASRKGSMFLLPNQPRPNTYRMEPDNEYRFRPYTLQAKILEVLIEQMKDQTYNGTTVNDLVKDISRSVHHLMKNISLPRYKIIIQTIISQKYQQLLRIASRCLWDPKTDNMLSVNYETKDMVAVVNVYAVYLE